MKLKFLLLFFFLIGIAGHLFAQLTDANYFLPTVLPKSPTSAAFAKYGDYQVNLFTGLPDISIPLYTIQSGGLEVPITLSYHASGIKISDVASWVGMGWTVSAGGSITRKVMGLPDEGGNGLLQLGIWHRTIDVYSTSSDIDYANLVVTGIDDSQPDIFSYNFPGHNGNFFFEGGNGLKPALVPFAPLAISHSTPVSANGYTMNFSILDEHGNNYNFGKTYTEPTVTVISGHTTQAVTGWMLESMISQNLRDTISFSYNNQPINYPDEPSQVDLVEDEISPINGVPFPYTGKYTPHFNNTTASSSVSEKDINTINFKNGKVVFELGGTKRTDQGYAYPLNDIKVYAYNYSSKTYQMQKEVVFLTGYLYSRLILTGIQILDAAGAIIQQYSFVYNQSVTMPAYGSLAKDYWGYYNGKDNSNSLIPQFTFPSPSNGTTYYIGSSNPASNNRITDSVDMKAMILQSINYPTGGHTDFTFQANQYIDSAGNNAVAGGLRIATIKSYDGMSATPIVKSYKYNTSRCNFFANGHNYLDLSYFLTTQIHDYWNAVGANAGTERYTSIVSNPNTDPAPFDQALVVYPSVTEYIGTPGSNIGRVDYVYRDFADQLQTSRSGSPIILKNFYRRGQLASKTQYMRLSNGTYQVVKKDTNTYTAFKQNDHGTAGWVIDKTTWHEGPGAPSVQDYPGGNTPYYPNSTNFFVPQNYSITSDDDYLTGTTTYTYDTNDYTKFTTSTVTYKYDDTVHQQVSRVYHTDSKGNTHITVNKYPHDYLNGGTTTHNALLDTMLNHNMQAELVEKWDSLKNVTTGTNTVTGGQLNYFKFGNMIGVSVVPASISILNSATPITGFVPANIVSGNITGDARYTQMIYFNNYDLKNNIVQYTPRNSTPISILWGYQYELPIAQVKNAVLSYDGANQTIAFTSFEAIGNTTDSKGNWSFSGSPVNDATAPDGFYCYNLTSGAIVSSNLNNTKSYVVSYWSKNGVATVQAASGAYASGRVLRSANGWTYYEHIVNSGTTTITVSGTTTIDALRLYPTDAQMTTYAYDPSGLRSIMDTKGQISYFEYDAFQRLKNIKDWNGNIVKNYGYHTFDQTFPNVATSVTTFTRNNCPAGTNPQSTTFSIPAGKYYSSTPTSANAEAAYDLAVNGQLKANTVCGCPVQMITFTLINASGLDGFQARFSGPSNQSFNFPLSGSSTVSLPAGTYTLYLPPVSPFNNHTWTLGNRTSVTDVSTTFNNVIIGIGSTDSSITVQ